MKYHIIRFACLALLLLSIFHLTRSQTLVSFKDKHGNVNYAEMDGTGSVRRIHGLTAHIRDYGQRETELNVQSVQELAGSLVADYQGVLKISTNQIRPVKIETDGTWWFAEFEQVHEGVPVCGSEIGFTIDSQGRIVTLGSRVYPEVSAPTHAVVSGEKALAIALRKFGGEATTVAGKPELIILPRESGSKFVYRLAWKMTLRSGMNSVTYFVSAEDGDILEDRTNVTESGVSGTVRGSYYPGKATDTPITVPFALPDIEAWNVRDQLGSASADAAGHYAINMNVAFQQIFVRFVLQNSLIQVRDNNGCEHLECSGDLVQPSVSALPGNTNVNYSFSGDGPNLYYHIPIIHDYFKNTFNFSGMDYQIRARINMGSNVNGVSNGYDIGFGTQLGRQWARSRDVLFHEYSHDVIEHIYGSQIRYLGDIQGAAMEEGLADYFACTFANDPLYSEDVDPNYRNLVNSLAWDINREYHLNGQVIGGALWNTRQAAGPAVADYLVFKALQLAPHAKNFQDLLFNMLKVDLSSYRGVNHSQIEAAFASHNIFPPGPAGTTIASQVASGWNMVSVPIQSYDYVNQVPKYDASFIFPTAGSPAFSYPVSNAPYAAQSTLAGGTGYFMSFPSTQYITYYGPAQNKVTINVHKGWNLIGSISTPLSTNNVRSLVDNVPAGIVVSNYFTLAGGYQVASTIQPGGGYWVNVSQDGQLVLDASAAPSPPAPISPVQPPPSPGAPPAPLLASPINGSTDQSIDPTLSWQPAGGATSYRVQVSAGPNFSSLAYDIGSIPSASQGIGPLPYATTYYWRVNATGSGGTSYWSDTWWFTTQAAPPQPCACCATSMSALDQFTVTDAHGDAQRMFAVNGGRRMAMGFTDVGMPPAPRQGIFHARFQSEKFVENIQPGKGVTNIPIVVRSAAYPVRLSWRILAENKITYWLAPGNGPNKVTLAGSGSTTFNGEPNGLITISAQAVNPCQPGSRTLSEGVEGGTPEKPAAYGLVQNHPNPFNPSTEIRYDLPEDVHVTLKVYNVLGRELTTLVDRNESAGSKVVVFNAGGYPSGVYFYRLQAAGFVDVKKFILMR